MTKEKQIKDITQYYVLRNKDTGMYFRGKGVNRWGKYFNQATIYRVKGTAEASVREVSWHGEKAEVVPIQIFENEAGYLKASEIFEEIDDLKRYIQLNEDIAIKCKRENGSQNEEYWKGKVAAFREIRAYIDAELKKKYTERESDNGN